MPTNPPLLVLDVDGVLNGHEWSWRPSSTYNPQIEAENVRAFNLIVDHFFAVNIVLSSAWRYLILNGHMDTYGFGALLRSHGLRGQLVGHTRADAKDADDDSYEARWCQIADWLKAPAFPYSGYCILDDMAEAFGGRPGVQTNGTVGLTVKDAELAISIIEAQRNGRDH